MKKIIFLLAAFACGAWCATAQTTASGHAWVDLGLPSGLKWAACNVGSDKPEEYGNYYAWGEITTKSTYAWGDYQHHTSSGNLLKYNTDDEKTVLDPEDDAARANLGGAWRMPTDAEWTELREQCDWTWITLNGKNGYEVKSRTNGNSIFLPAAGCCSNDVLGGAGSDGFYWSSSLGTDSPDYACNLFFDQEDVFREYGCRYYGMSVRPVINVAEPQKVDLGLPSGTKWATCNVGASAPEEYGNYYAWGETETKETYTWNNYTLTEDGGSTFTKYTTDGKTVLDPEDDAAAVNWGGAWRMPTKEEINELITNCTWTYTTTYNGKSVKGYVVKSQTNDNSIFLPAAGLKIESSVGYVGSFGVYWTSNLYTGDNSRALELWFNKSQTDNPIKEEFHSRYTGRSVRAVTKENGSTTALQPATAAVDVYATAGRIVCEGEFRIYDLLGRDVTRLNGSLNGVYVVKTADSAVKVVVK